MSDVICVTAAKLCRENLLERIEKIAAEHPAAILLREKELSEAAYEALAEDVMRICDKYGVPCILHYFDRTARKLHADNLHLPLPLLRELSEEERRSYRRLGTSCHSLSDAREAAALGCTYLVAGHIFETDCKKGLPGRGLDFLQQIVQEIPLPVYGIGGINETNAEQVRTTGAAGICLMSSLMQAEDLHGYMEALSR